MVKYRKLYTLEELEEISPKNNLRRIRSNLGEISFWMFLFLIVYITDVVHHW